jgi:hypothetical protein
MPAAFHREAIAIALGTKDHPLVPEHHPANFGEVAHILAELNPEQRCDAIYADWLLQLHNPGNEAHIQIRDLLLGQGAMDAHYLAELVHAERGHATFPDFIKGTLRRNRRPYRVPKVR